MRPWTEKVYGIPPEQVVGSSIKTKFEMKDGKPILVRLPEIDFIDDKAGKPVGIHKFIWRRPIAAFGNSDGDLCDLRLETDLLLSGTTPAILRDSDKKDRLLANHQASDQDQGESRALRSEVASAFGFCVPVAHHYRAVFG